MSRRMPVVPDLGGRGRRIVETSLGYLMRSCLKYTKKNKVEGKSLAHAPLPGAFLFVHNLKISHACQTTSGAECCPSQTLRGACL